MSKPYQAIIRPVGSAFEWVVQDLEGENHESRAMMLYTYLAEMGVTVFDITHYAESIIIDIAIEDICLN